jgi:hypothetical protein
MVSTGAPDPIQQFASILKAKFRPERAKKVSLAFHYIILDEVAGTVYLQISIAHNMLEINRVESPADDVPAVIVQKDGFVDFINGKKMPFELFFKRGMKIVGNPLLIFSAMKCFD